MKKKLALISISALLFSATVNVPNAYAGEDGEDGEEDIEGFFGWFFDDGPY